MKKFIILLDEKKPKPTTPFSRPTPKPPSDGHKGSRQPKQEIPTATSNPKPFPPIKKTK